MAMVFLGLSQLPGICFLKGLHQISYRPMFCAKPNRITVIDAATYKNEK